MLKNSLIKKIVLCATLTGLAAPTANCIFWPAENPKTNVFQVPKIGVLTILSLGLLYKMVESIFYSATKKASDRIGEQIGESFLWPIKKLFPSFLKSNDSEKFTKIAKPSYSYKKSKIEDLILLERRINLPQELKDMLQDKNVESYKGLLIETINQLKMQYKDSLQPLYHMSNGKLKTQGILLHGEPGNGKTTIARTITNELSKIYNVTFIPVDASQTKHHYVGIAEDQLKGIMKTLRRAGRKQLKIEKALYTKLGKKPKENLAILFLDEIESISIDRDKDNKTGNTNLGVIDTFLNEIDPNNPVNKNVNILIIGATNKAKLMDGAVKRRLLPIEIPSPRNSEERQHFANKFVEMREKEGVKFTDNAKKYILEELSKNQHTGGFAACDIESVFTRSILKIVNKKASVIFKNLENKKINEYEAKQKSKAESKNIIIDINNLIVATHEAKQAFLTRKKSDKSKLHNIDTSLSNRLFDFNRSANYSPISYNTSSKYKTTKDIFKKADEIKETKSFSEKTNFFEKINSNENIEKPQTKKRRNYTQAIRTRKKLKHHLKPATY